MISNEIIVTQKAKILTWCTSSSSFFLKSTFGSDLFKGQVSSMGFSRPISRVSSTPGKADSPGSADLPPSRLPSEWPLSPSRAAQTSASSLPPSSVAHHAIHVSWLHRSPVDWKVTCVTFKLKQIVQQTCKSSHTSHNRHQHFLAYSNLTHAISCHVRGKAAGPTASTKS